MFTCTITRSVGAVTPVEYTTEVIKPAADAPLTLRTPTHVCFRQSESAGLKALSRWHAGCGTFSNVVPPPARSSCRWKKTNKQTITTHYEPLCIWGLTVNSRGRTHTLRLAFSDSSPSPPQLHPRAVNTSLGLRPPGVSVSDRRSLAAAAAVCRVCACHTRTLNKKYSDYTGARVTAVTLLSYLANPLT